MIISAALRNLLSEAPHQPSPAPSCRPFLCVYTRCFFVAVAFDALCISSFSVLSLFALLLSSPVLCLFSGKNRSKKDHPNHDLHPSSRQYALKCRNTLVEAPPWSVPQMYLRLAITTMTYASVASSPWLPLPQPHSSWLHPLVPPLSHSCSQTPAENKHCRAPIGIIMGRGAAK